MARSRRRIQPAPTVDWLLVHPGFFPNGMAQGSCATHEGLAGAIATRDKLSEVKFRPDVKFKFCFQSGGGTLVLDTGCLEIPDPYGVRPIKLWAEVLSTHYQLVLFRICGSPTGFFVYSFPCVADAHVVELPNVAPKIWSSGSFGILRHKSESDKYVVANLEIGRNEAFLDMWWHSSSSSWLSGSGCRESVTLPPEIYEGRKWKTRKVVPCSDLIFKRSPFSEPLKLNALLFVDLKKGIIVCHNFLNFKERNAAKIEFIDLPKEEEVRRMPVVRRQEAFMSVGCCNGKLKFVNLYISAVNKVDVTIMTFDGWSWQQTSSFTLVFGEMYIPCFPVVSANEDNILYLIMASEVRKQASVIVVNTESSEILVHAEYLGFWKILKPPYSINRF